MKKALITGSQNSGKTTLLHALGAHARRHHLAWECLEELNRPLTHRFPDLADSPAAYYLFFTLQRHREYEALLTHHPEWLFCDQGVVDFLVSLALSPYCFKPEAQWLKAAQEYDLVLICDFRDISLNSPSSQINTSESFQDALLNLLTELALPWVLLSGSVETRLESVIELMERPLLRRSKE